MTRLIWSTPNGEELLVYMARVSNPEGQERGDSPERLIRYLIRHRHWSPFEMVSACVEIEAPRDVSRQLLRHRSFAFQEFCVAEGTLITTVTERGNTKKLPIEKLFEYQSDKRMAAIWQRGIRVFDEATRTFVRSTIKEVFDTGVKPCFTVTLSDGKSLTCTMDHKLFTPDGFTRLSDLRPGDMVGVNGQKPYMSKDWMKAAKARSLVVNGGVSQIAREAGVSYHTIRKWLKIHGLQFTKKESAIVAGGAWNKGLPAEEQPNYGRVHSAETREKMRAAAKSGPESEFYRGGVTRSFRQSVFDWQNKWKNAIHKRDGEVCLSCGSQGRLEVDHILPVFSHPELAFSFENLQSLCRECHRKKSAAESVRSRQTVRWKEIVSIVPAGEKQTYDIEVEHESHNYIANGIVTHNSQRYQSVNALPEAPLRECRMQDERNRQNSLPCEDDDTAKWWEQAQASASAFAGGVYDEALERGIAKEVARAVLSEGLTMSRLYMAGTLRSWLHFCSVRSGEDTQAETRKIAHEVADLLREEFPATWRAFEEHEALEARVRQALTTTPDPTTLNIGGGR